MSREAAARFVAVLLGLPGAGSREHLADLASDASEVDWSPARQIPSALLRSLREGSTPSTPVGLLMVFLFLYVIAVGPADYLVLKRMRKLQYSALSLVLLAVTFSAVAFVAAFLVFAGGREIRRITVVDIAPDPAADGADLIRIEDYAAVYVPRGGSIPLAPAGFVSVTDRLADPDDYSGGLSPAILSGGLAREFRSPLAARAVLGVPFRASRFLRSVHLRSEPFPLSCRAADGGPVVLTNGLATDLAGATLAGPGLLVPLGDVPSGREATFDWVGMPAGKYLSVPHAGDLFAALRRPGDLHATGRGLVSLSLAPAGHDDPGGARHADWRFVSRFGLQRPGRLAAGGRMLAAYTLAPDPLGLPLADVPGISVTVFRKAIEP